jgi:hypothetical protein
LTCFFGFWPLWFIGEGSKNGGVSRSV